MAVIADSGAIYALYDADDRHHRSVRLATQRERGPFIVPSVLLAEVDYLLRQYLETNAELDFLDDILGGFFTIEPPHRSDLTRCRELIEKYADLDLGLADSSVIATAERLGVDRILTLDRRHFRVVRSMKGRAFVLLPEE